MIRVTLMDQIIAKNLLQIMKILKHEVKLLETTNKTGFDYPKQIKIL